MHQNANCSLHSCPSKYILFYLISAGFSLYKPNGSKTILKKDISVHSWSKILWTTLDLIFRDCLEQTSLDSELRKKSWDHVDKLNQNTNQVS